MAERRRVVPLSLHDYYCDGYGNPGAVGNGYLLGLMLGTGKTAVSPLIEEGLDGLEAIDAFDRAEVDETFIGQINMITVSSFCGPMGYIWGYDLARHENLYVPPQWGPDRVTLGRQTTPVYSLSPLLEATRRLFGMVEAKRFPLLPGSHVPCAKKSLEARGGGYLYCGLGLGIPVDRGENACLLMEDVGKVGDDAGEMRGGLSERLAMSVLRVGENQRVVYKEIFVMIKMIGLDEGEIGCALAAAPYFSLAKKASLGDGQALFEMNLADWERSSR